METWAFRFIFLEGVQSWETLLKSSMTPLATLASLRRYSSWSSRVCVTRRSTLTDLLASRRLQCSGRWSPFSTMLQDTSMPSSISSTGISTKNQNKENDIYDDYDGQDC